MKRRKIFSNQTIDLFVFFLDNHLTYECYLAPRLSNSNYAFHDIYWNYEDDKVNRLIFL